MANEESVVNVQKQFYCSLFIESTSGKADVKRRKQMIPVAN